MSKRSSAVASRKEKEGRNYAPRAEEITNKLKRVRDEDKMKVGSSFLTSDVTPIMNL